MDEGKQTLQKERRESKAEEVLITFIDGAFQHFNVLDSEGKIKHLGILMEKEPHAKDMCTCSSFYFGNSDEYKKSHPAAFQCKHLIKSRKTRYEGHPQ